MKTQIPEKGSLLNMDQPLFVLKSEMNKKNRSRCEVYEDHVVLTTECDGGLMPVYANETRTIPFEDIEDVVISRDGVKIIAHHPNCIHFVTKDCKRTIDDMYRDRSFHAKDYIHFGVHQFVPKTETELEEKVDVAKEIRKFILEKKKAAEEAVTSTK